MDSESWAQNSESWWYTAYWFSIVSAYNTIFVLDQNEYIYIKSHSNIYNCRIHWGMRTDKSITPEICVRKNWSSTRYHSGTSYYFTVTAIILSQEVPKAVKRCEFHRDEAYWGGSSAHFFFKWKLPFCSGGHNTPAKGV